jgi:hypothetical protein
MDNFESQALYFKLFHTVLNINNAPFAFVQRDVPIEIIIGSNINILASRSGPKTPCSLVFFSFSFLRVQNWTCT